MGPRKAHGGPRHVRLTGAGVQGPALTKGAASLRLFFKEHEEKHGKYFRHLFYSHWKNETNTI